MRFQDSPSAEQAAASHGVMPPPPPVKQPPLAAPKEKRQTAASVEITSSPEPVDRSVFADQVRAVNLQFPNMAVETIDESIHEALQNIKPPAETDDQWTDREKFLRVAAWEGGNFGTKTKVGVMWSSALRANEVLKNRYAAVGKGYLEQRKFRDNWVLLILVVPWFNITVWSPRK